MDKQQQNDIRLLPDGELWEYSTEKYDLFLEYEKNTLIISLNGESKFFRQIICDLNRQRYLYHGKYYKAEEIFSWFKENSIEKNDESYLQNGCVFFYFRRISLKQVKLVGKMLQRVQAVWKARRNIKKGRKLSREEMQNLVDKTCKLNKSYLFCEQMKVKIMQMYDRENIRVAATPYIQWFQIEHSHITKIRDKKIRMGLLNMVVGELFCFHVKIQNRKGWIWFGVTDRCTQKEREWAQFPHSVQYGCYYGRIYYGIGDGQYKYMESEKIDGGTEVQVKVEKCSVIFTVHTKSGPPRQYQVQSPILGDPHRKLVPFFAMDTIGDSITFHI